MATIVICNYLFQRQEIRGSGSEVCWQSRFAGHWLEVSTQKMWHRQNLKSDLQSFSFKREDDKVLKSFLSTNSQGSSHTQDGWNTRWNSFLGQRFFILSLHYLCWSFLLLIHNEEPVVSALSYYLSLLPLAMLLCSLHFKKGFFKSSIMVHDIVCIIKFVGYLLRRKCNFHCSKNIFLIFSMLQSKSLTKYISWSHNCSKVGL